MRIESITLAVRDVAVQRVFYAETLGLTVLEDEIERFTVQAGATRLTFKDGESDQGGGSYHVAFNVPENLLEEASAWLRERGIPVLMHHGKEIVVQSPQWNAHSVYFRDPDGNVAEFIARRRLQDRADGSFAPAQHVRCVSELGLPVEDVAAVTGRLQREAALTTYGTSSPEFAPLGDEQGLLIVVARGRGWFPTTTRAHSEPLEALIEAPVERETEATVGTTRLRVLPGRRGAR